MPGDTINLADGKYTGRFKLNQNGTRRKRITLKGTKKAVLTNPQNEALQLIGVSWWILDGHNFK